MIIDSLSSLLTDWRHNGWHRPDSYCSYLYGSHFAEISVSCVISPTCSSQRKKWVSEGIAEASYVYAVFKSVLGFLDHLHNLFYYHYHVFSSRMNF